MHFARPPERGEDQFDGISHCVDENGVPLLPDVAAGRYWFNVPFPIAPTVVCRALPVLCYAQNAAPVECVPKYRCL